MRIVNEMTRGKYVQYERTTQEKNQDEKLDISAFQNEAQLLSSQHDSLLFLFEIDNG